MYNLCLQHTVPDLSGLNNIRAEEGLERIAR